jgi:outer membrane protein assembly factor BamB
MRRALVLLLGLGAIVFLAPGESQSQPGEVEVPPGQQSNPGKHLGGLLSNRTSADPMDLFDRISGGKRFITPDDVAGLELLKADFQSFLGATGNAGDRVSREEFFAIVEWRKEQQRLQRELFIKQLELQREHLLAGGDLGTLPNLPGMQGLMPQPGGNGDPNKQKHEKGGHEQPGEHQHHENEQALQQQQLMQQQMQANLEAEIENAFRSHRLNKEGQIPKEAAEPPLRSQWDIWDFDANGAIDLQEFRAFIMAQRMGWNPQKGGPNPFRPSWAVEPRTPVYRKGKLPSGLPSWFADLANNEEGQIFLFDWRAAGRKDEEFFAMDLNGDGILTPEEVLDYLKKLAQAASSILVVQPSSNTVMEVGPDGTPKWTMSGLANPRDVELLKAGIVLVTEQNQVTERTTTGKVLWKYAVNEPLSAQRLSSGHTFIVCQDRLIEVDRSGREVMNASMNVAAARKMADGKIVAFDRQNVMELDQRGQVLKRAHCNCGGGGHNEVTDSGHVLALSPGNGNIKEFDTDGNEVGNFNYPGAVYGSRMPGGHIFVTHESGTEYLELDESWNLVKSSSLDAPAMKVKVGKAVDKDSQGSGSGSNPGKTGKRLQPTP